MSSVQFSHFDREHWHKVKAERIKQGIPDKAEHGRLLADHPMSNAVIVDKATARTYEVVRVKMNWDLGRFVSVVILAGESHAELVIENISSHQPWVDKKVAQFNEQYEVNFPH